MYRSKYVLTNTCKYVYSLDMNIQTLIANLRDHGFTQAEIAKNSGLSQATISRLASGKHSDTSYLNAKHLEELLALANINAPAE